MNKNELIEKIMKFYPFELGDDPYKCGQSDTLDRVIELIVKEM